LARPKRLARPRNCLTCGSSLTNIALDIFRKRLLVGGYFQCDMAESVLRDYFRHTMSWDFETYGDPIIHKARGLMLSCR
jgi:hypothetical protein